ncbi:hypothetical protein FISHEDRAFT_62962 [Fistulina hepatica ATCC 64428]|uniref:Uncharacterized protein n=1 Tax=Fistulina hepatica ATCC 64428 TaxID=1128425 RepID=A0A0D7A298_9AGAR|nr:hypothetical protein FISHEDRAFT_62962 [Fistulina hepatica ATCC 64428]
MAHLFLAYAFILFKSQNYYNRIHWISISRDKYTLNITDAEIVEYNKILFAHAKDSMSLKRSMVNTLQLDLFDRDLVDLTSYYISNSVHHQMAILASLHGFIFEPTSPQN